MVLGFLLNAVFHHSLLLVPAVESHRPSPDVYILSEHNNTEISWRRCSKSPCTVYEDIPLGVTECNCLEPSMFNVSSSSEIFRVQINRVQEITPSLNSLRTTFYKELNLTKTPNCGGVLFGQDQWLTELECSVLQCRFTLDIPENCPLKYEKAEDMIFWIYFLLRFLATWALSASVTMMDPIILLMIDKFGGQFGRERIFTTIGMAIFSPFTGLLIDQRSRQLGK